MTRLYTKHYGTVTDTIFIDTVASVFQYDSSLTFDPGASDTTYQLRLDCVQDSGDYPVTLMFSTEDGVGRDSFPVYLSLNPDDADSITTRFYINGSLSLSQVFDPPTLDYTYSLTANSHHSVDARIYWQGDTLPQGVCFMANTIETGDSVMFDTLTDTLYVPQTVPIAGSKWVNAYIIVTDQTIDTNASTLNPRPGVDLLLELQSPSTPYMDVS